MAKTRQISSTEDFLFFEKCVLCHFKNRDALMVNRLGLRCAREEGRILDCCSQISRRLFPLIQHTVEDQFSDCSGKCHLKSWGQLRTASLCYLPFDTEVLHVVVSKTDDCKIKILLDYGVSTWNSWTNTKSKKFTLFKRNFLMSPRHWFTL